VPPVIQQETCSFPDPLLVHPPRGHVVQQGDVGDNLLGVVVLTRDGHLATSWLLDKIMPYLFSAGQSLVYA
jgi:hypothetical protein